MKGSQGGLGAFKRRNLSLRMKEKDSQESGVVLIVLTVEF